MGSFSAWFGVAARVTFAAGVDAFLPRAFGWRSRRTGAPTVAIAVRGVATAVLVVLGWSGGAGLKAAYDFLVAMTVLSYTLPFLILFVIYVKVQDRTLPSDGWAPPAGARTLGVIGFVFALLAVLCTLAPSPDAPDKAGAVLKLLVACGVLIASGVGVYALGEGRSRHKPI